MSLRQRMLVVAGLLMVAFAMYLWPDFELATIQAKNYLFPSTWSPGPAPAVRVEQGSFTVDW